MQKVFTRIIIKDEANNVLVVQDRKNTWNFPGGKLEFGETPLECAIRETKEEIGLNIHKLLKVYKGTFKFGTTEWLGYFYFANIVSEKPSIYEMDKIREIRFINGGENINFPMELSEAIEEIFKSNLIFNKTTSWEKENYV